MGQARRGSEVAPSTVRVRVRPTGNSVVPAERSLSVAKSRSQRPQAVGRSTHDSERRAVAADNGPYQPKKGKGEDRRKSGGRRRSGERRRSTRAKGKRQKGLTGLVGGLVGGVEVLEVWLDVSTALWR